MIRVTGRHRRGGRIAAAGDGILVRSMTTRRPPDPDPDRPLSVALVTLGCARNEVDSEELAGRLEADGFRLVDDADDADTVVVNTCGFVEAAKKDSVDTLLEAADLKATGPHPGRGRRRLPRRALRQGPRRRRCPRPTPCSASTTTPTSPPGCARSWRVRRTTPHTPQDRRKLLPITPVERAPRSTTSACPGLGGPRAVRRRLDGGPMAPLKLASGCDRRCSFCAIPSFRGSFVSRRPSDVLGEARLAGRPGRHASCSWSARTPRPTARTSATCGCSRRCCPSWPPSTASSGCGSPTCSRPRPGPGLVEAIATTPGVAPYFDLSFQHASAVGAAPDAPLRRPGVASSACSSRSGRSRPRPASAPT